MNNRDENLSLITWTCMPIEYTVECLLFRSSFYNLTKL